MRTLVNIPEQDLELLNAISKSEQISRAEIVRRAIAEYLALHKGKDSGIDEAFGLWTERAEDGLAYQERMRGEWER